MEKKELLYEGKAKKLYLTNEDEVLLVEYIDQATALNGAKKDQISGKGAMNNEISSLIFQRIAAKGIKSHFIRKVSKTEQLVKAVGIIPLEVVVRNVAAGSFSKRFGIEEGQSLDFPILEFYFKNDALNDPFMNEDHVRYLQLASEEEIVKIKEIALQVNQVLLVLFQEIGIRLIDFKIEFGRDSEGHVLLADEISPDTCRLWDIETNAHLDKDIYRRDLGDLVPVYQEVLQRLESKGE